MRHNPFVSSRFLGTAILCLLGFTLAGCSTSPAEYIQLRLAQQGDTRLDHVLRSNINAIGGIDAWARLQGIEGDAIANVVGAAGDNTLIQQHYVLMPGERFTIEVYSKEPDGIMKEWFDKRGKIQAVFQGNVNQNTIDPGKIDLYAAALRLRLINQALTGAVGLLQKDFSLRYAGQERKGGKLMYKIEVIGPLLGRKQFDYDTTGNMMVAWIDAESFLFERLWLRYRLENNQFGYLAVNITDYAQTLKGLVLPRLIEFVRSDEHQQIGHLQMMNLEFQNLRVIAYDK